MKLLITTLLILSFTALFSQGHFIAKYYPSSSDSVADGSLKLDYVGFTNPVTFSVVFGDVIDLQGYTYDVFFDVSEDTIINGDSISNILISEINSIANINRGYEAFKAYAIDLTTLDTLSIIKSKGYNSSYNEIKLGYLQDFSSTTISPCDGVVLVDTTFLTANDTIYNILGTSYSLSGDMFPQYNFNNESNTSHLPDFGVYNLCSDYYEFASSLGFSIAFRVYDSTNIDTSTSSTPFTVNITTTMDSLACNGSAYATSTTNTGPYQYYWDSNSPVNDSIINGLCAGSHTLDVVNVSGDSIHQDFYIISPIPVDSAFASSNVVVTESPYIDCYNSSTVNVNSTTGPFTYSWDGGVFGSSNIKNGLCAGYHNLSVANSIGDTVSLSTFNHTLSFMSTFSALSSCLGKAEMHIDSTNLDISNFRYSWSGGAFTFNNRVDSLCSGNHTLLIIDGFGDTLVQNFTIDVLRFNLYSYSNIDTCSSFANLMPEGDPFAFFPDIGPGRDSIYISWNQLPFELFSQDNQSIDSLCEGIYSLRIAGDVLGSDTMILPFAIASPNNTFNHDNIIVMDDSVNYYIENCSINYSLPIDSSNISNFEIISNNYAVYTVDLWQSGSLTQLSDTVLSYGDTSSSLQISITFYCYQKSNSNIINIIDVVTPTNTSTPTTPSTSINEKTVNTITIFPNPTNNVLNIETGENLRFKIKIYDSRGQLVLQSNEKQIDVSLLANGLYYLNYQSKNSFSTSKFIKK